MIFSISGARGQGKTTVISSLREEGFNVIENKTARGILSDWDKTLSEVYSNKLLAIHFHEEILRRHSDLCSLYENSEQVFFLERSFADIFSYANSIIGPYNEHSEWLYDFYHECAQSQTSLAAAIYLTGREYVPEDDGVRSVNRFYAETIDFSIKKRLYEFSDMTNTHCVFTVNSPSNEVRVQTIIDIVKSIT